MPKTCFVVGPIAGSNPAAPIPRALTLFGHRCHFLL